MSDQGHIPPSWQARYEANLAAFAGKFPALAAQLHTIAHPASRIIGSEADGTINLDLGHTILYPESATRYTEDQLAYFKSNPSRFYMDPPQRVDPPYHQQHFLIQSLYTHLQEKSVRAIPLNPTPDAGYMLIYGIGLGYHLPTLLDEYPVRHFILVDEYIEFFNHTLYLQDWVGILARMEARGQTLRFVFSADPLALSIQVHFDMRGQGFGLIDGSYLYRHYRSPLLDKAYEDFREKLPLLPISIGFFEDELVMLDHCTRNLINNRFHLLEERPRPEKPIPAVIVGSGPSLDKTIEVLKKIQDQVAIFSCGTAILPLLRNGIRPDFHCELENGWSSYYQIKQAGEQYSLDGITLIGSTTVWPAMPKLFSKSILYFRNSVSSTGLWCPDRTGILGTAPTCTNLAVRAAMVLCFKELYLFGVDLGTRDPTAHHSRHAIYHEDKAWLDAQETDPNKRMEIELPGNFGGKAYTNAILHWARMMLIQSIDVFSFAKIYEYLRRGQRAGHHPETGQDHPPRRAAGAQGRHPEPPDAGTRPEGAPCDGRSGGIARVAHRLCRLFRRPARSDGGGTDRAHGLYPVLRGDPPVPAKNRGQSVSTRVSVGHDRHPDDVFSGRLLFLSPGRARRSTGPDAGLSGRVRPRPRRLGRNDG